MDPVTKGAPRNKKGIFFTVDALVATGIILLGLLLIPGLYFNKQPTVHLSYISQDMVSVLSELKVYELDNSYTAYLISSGYITNANNSVLEQIGELWAEGNDDIARNFTREIIEGIIPSGYGYGLWVGEQEIYSTEKPESSMLISSRKVISGYEKLLPVLGYTSRVYLSSVKERMASSFVYFGGFVGEGNVSSKVFLPQNITNITNAYLEVLIGTDSKFYINGEYAGSYPKGSGNGTYIAPSIWVIDPGYYSLFNPGENNISIKFEYLNENFTAEGPQYLGGGYFKVAYITPDTEELEIEYSGSTASRKSWLPGIKGFINLYSSIYVPGNLSSMKIYLKFFSNYTTYMTIGGVTVYEEKTNGTTEVTLTNSQLSSIFAGEGWGYDELSLTTIPIRIGLKNVTRTSAPIDAVLVTDVSGSMRWRMDQDNVNGVIRACNDTNLNLPTTERLSVAKCADKDFVQTILANAGPLVGLVSYQTTTSTKTWLTSNQTALQNQINSYAANGGTCICCGVNSAVEMLRNSTQVTFVSRKTGGWKYNDDDLASDPSGWTSISFNDSSWSTGAAALGNGYAGLNTIVDKYEGYYYFRKKFNATNVTNIKYAQLTVFSDDGADIYLNGILVDHDIQNKHSAEYWNRYVEINTSLLQEGENIIAAKLRNRQDCWWFSCWVRSPAFDLEFYGSTSSGLAGGSKKKAIIIMSDGEANYECAEQGNSGDQDHDGSSDTAKDDAIKATCDAYKNYGITTFSVGFSTAADETTLQYMSNCTDGAYFSSTNYDELRDTYLIIIDELIQFTETQAVNETDVIPTELFFDSYIELNYTPEVPAPVYGEIPVTGETSKFGNTISRGSIILPEGDTLLELFATSYSADKWTDEVYANNSAGMTTAFNLSRFGASYRDLGDAFNVYIPPSAILAGEQNYVTVKTAIAPGNQTGGSEYNRLIFRARVNSLLDYGTVFLVKEGCEWHIQFEDGQNETIKVPLAYSGTQQCYYANQTYDPSDALDDAAFRLFSQLDFDGNGKLEIRLDENNLQADTLTVSDVPSLWGPAIVEVRLW